jgi:transposase
MNKSDDEYLPPSREEDTMSQTRHASVGIDVAKAKFDAALLREGKLVQRTFTMDPAGFTALDRWIREQGVEPVHACLEATGEYGAALALALYEAGHQVSIVNPARIAAYAKSRLTRTKTDKTDAALIARFCAREQPPIWTPPSTELQELQALVRRVEMLQEMVQQEENRRQSGGSSRAVQASIEATLAFLRQELAKTQRLVQQQVDQSAELRSQQQLLCSIPGVGAWTAARVLAEIEVLRASVDARQLAAYAGLTPRERRSGSSVHHPPRLAKTGNSRLRRALYLPAIVAMRHNPAIHALAERLRARGKRPMVIVGAAMRKLLHLIYGVLKSGTPFDPALALAA